MYYFDRFDPLEGDVPLYPFFGLFDIAWKAREFLKGTSKNEILWIEKDVDYQIERVREFLYKKALEELKITDEAALKDFEDEYEEISEVEALSFAVDVGWCPTDSEETGFCAVKCAAVLSLMFVAECVDTLECSEEDLGFSEGGPIEARLVNAANSAFNAALAIGLALKYECHIKITNDMEVHAEESLANFSRDRARRAAKIKHAPTSLAKEFITAEWAKNKSAYGGNKSEFSRAYVRRVYNEFHVSITEKQMREVWLKDPPSASKPDGVPVSG